MVHVPPDVAEHGASSLDVAKKTRAAREPGVAGSGASESSGRAKPGRVRLALKYYMFRLAAALVPLVPPRLGSWLAAIGGDLAWRMQAKTRQIVEGNLRQVLGPEASQAEVGRLARNVFRHSARNYFDLFRIPSLSRDRLSKIVVAEGMENIFDGLAEGKGVIVVAPHLGSFDLVAQIGTAYSLLITMTVERIKPPKLLALISRMREAKGIHLVPVGGGALKEVQRALVDNELVAMAADRDVMRNGTAVRFFGRETTVPDAPAFLAWRYGAAVVTACCERKPDGTYALHVGPRLPLQNTGHSRSDIQANSQLITEALEKIIRAYPDQWVVFEPVWGRKTK